jgi:hypothetical protein
MNTNSLSARGRRGQADAAQERGGHPHAHADRARIKSGVILIGDRPGGVRYRWYASHSAGLRQPFAYLGDNPIRMTRHPSLLRRKPTPNSFSESPCRYSTALAVSPWTTTQCGARTASLTGTSLVLCNRRSRTASCIARSSTAIRCNVTESFSSAASTKVTVTLWSTLASGCSLARGAQPHKAIVSTRMLFPVQNRMRFRR